MTEIPAKGRGVVDHQAMNYAAFAKRCALEVSYLWDCPEIVRLYLLADGDDLREQAASEMDRLAWPNNTVLWTTTSTVNGKVVFVTPEYTAARMIAKSAVDPCPYAAAQGVVLNSAWTPSLKDTSARWKAELSEARQ